MNLSKIAARIAQQTALSNEDFLFLKSMSTVCGTKISWKGDTLQVDMAYEDPRLWWIGNQKYVPDDAELKQIVDAYKNTPRDTKNKSNFRWSEQAFDNMKAEFGNVALHVLQEYYGDKAGW